MKTKRIAATFLVAMFLLGGIAAAVEKSEANENTGGGGNGSLSPLPVKVISPNGGEEWKVDSWHQIKWSVNLSKNYECAVDLYQKGVDHYKNIVANYPYNRYLWHINITDLPTTPDLFTNEYKISVRCNEIGGWTTYADQSDDWFKIVSATTTINTTAINEG